MPGDGPHAFCRYIPIFSVIGPETIVKVRFYRSNIDAEVPIFLSTLLHWNQDYLYLQRPIAIIFGVTYFLLDNNPFFVYSNIVSSISNSCYQFTHNYTASSHYSN